MLAEIEGAALTPVDLFVEPSAHLFRIEFPGGRFVEGSAGFVSNTIHKYVNLDLVSSHPLSPLIHGASVIVGGKRCLIMAPKESGKSTLTLYLLTRGHPVEGDENIVVLDHGRVVARPRAMRVREGTFALVADMTPIGRNAKQAIQWDGLVVRAVTPTMLGYPWVIREGRPDHLVFLEPNHGGLSVAWPVGQEEALRRLMPNTYLADDARIPSFLSLRRLCRETPAHVLRIGDLAGAERHLLWLARP